jgi:hypothetical protein
MFRGIGRQNFATVTNHHSLALGTITELLNTRALAANMDWEEGKGRLLVTTKKQYEIKTAACMHL